MMRDLKFTIPVIILIMLVISCGEEKQENSKDTSQTEEKADVQVQEFIDVDISAMSSLEQGDRVEITNEHRDELYNLQVRKVQETMPGVLSISANIEDRETGLAIMTIADEQLSGSFEFYKENLRYQIRYDSVQSRHYLLEIKEDNDMEGSAPLEYPEEN